LAGAELVNVRPKGIASDEKAAPDKVFCFLKCTVLVLDADHLEAITGGPHDELRQRQIRGSSAQ